MQTGAHAEVQTHEAAPEAAAAAPDPAKEFASALGNAALARRITAINSAAVARNGDGKKEDTPEERAKKAASKAMPAKMGDFLNVAWGDMLPGASLSMKKNTQLFGRSYKKSIEAINIPVGVPLVWLQFGGGVKAYAKADGGYRLAYNRKPAPMDKPMAVDDTIEGDGNIAFKAQAEGSVFTGLAVGVPGANVSARLTASLVGDAEGSVQVWGNLTRSGNDPDKGDMNKFNGSLAYKANVDGKIYARAKAGFNATLRTPIEDKEEEAVVTLGKWDIGWFKITGNGFVDPNTGQVRNYLKVEGDFGKKPDITEAGKKRLDSRVRWLGPQVAFNDEPGEGPQVADAGTPPGGEDDDATVGDGGPAPAVVA